MTRAGETDAFAAATRYFAGTLLDEARVRTYVPSVISVGTVANHPQTDIETGKIFMTRPLGGLARQT